MRILTIAMFALLSLGASDMGQAQGTDTQTVIPAAPRTGSEATAQANTPVPSAPAGVAAPSFVIGPNDSISIMAVDADELNKSWRVSSSGDLNLPLVGTIHAAGLTAGQLEDQVRERLKRYIREPEVTVYITEYRSQVVSVTGAVGIPGPVLLNGAATLLSVLTTAGGLKAPGPTVTVTRDMKFGEIPLLGAKTSSDGKHSTIQLKVTDVLDAGSSAANLSIRPGDAIVVSTEQQLVYIIGEVNRPGAVQLVSHDSVSVLQVLAASGGMTKQAAPRHTQIMRVNPQGLYERVASIDLKKVMTGKKEDRLLTAGDIIVVPTSGLKTYTQAASMSVISAGVIILTRF